MIGAAPQLVSTALQLTGDTLQLKDTTPSSIFRPSADGCLLLPGMCRPQLRGFAPQLIGDSLRLTGATLQLIGAILIFDILPLR